MLQRESVRAPQILPAASAQITSRYENHKTGTTSRCPVCIIGHICLNLLLYYIKQRNAHFMN
jgi:hypothetical protein